MKKTILFLITILGMVITHAQNVNIPDANLKSNLVLNSAINTNGDSEIQVSEANAYSGDIICPYENISDLTGIEAFTSLNGLFCYGNSISYIDVSSNTSLTKLNCKENHPLTSLNVANGNNVNFTFFRASLLPSLTCIQVDDANYSTNNWIPSQINSYEFDGGVIFSENCNPSILVSSITVDGQGGVSTITTNGGTLQMEASIFPANADDMTYTWTIVNGTGTATINASGLLTASADGTVEVKATANDASGATGSKTITISNQSVGIQDLSFSNLNVYPNPTTGIVNIAVGSEAITSIRVFDLAGRVVKQYGNESQINEADITKGIYMLEIANEDKLSIVKLVVR